MPAPVLRDRDLSGTRRGDRRRQRREHLAGVGELRHAIRAHERRHLDHRQAGRRQPLDEGDLVGGGDPRRFVLQPVARPDFDDRDRLVMPPHRPVRRSAAGSLVERPDRHIGVALGIQAGYDFHRPAADLAVLDVVLRGAAADVHPDGQRLAARRTATPRSPRVQAYRAGRGRRGPEHTVVRRPNATLIARMPLDLLVFGPHPDDIEIGMGGTVALHARRGDRVGLVDLTRGELGSNGTPDERVAEAAEASAVLGAALRLNLALPDGCLSVDDEAQVDAVVRCVRAHRPRAIAIPHWEDRHPDHGNASRLLRQAIFRAGLRRVAGGDEPWRPEWVCHYFINDAAPPSFVVDVSDGLRDQAAGAGLPSHAIHAGRRRGDRDPPHVAAVLAVDREPRRPVRGARRRPLRRRLRRARAGGPAAPVQDLAGADRRVGAAACVSGAAPRHRRRAGQGMRIGIVCYASVGGSGVVATELATSLARRGHEVHVLSSEIPFRLRDARGPVVVHAIDTPAYPLFREPQYVLSLSTKIVNVARAHALDIIHAHYAVPHAAGAYLARQILASHGAAVPKVVTTLHGTDITLVGADPSYRETVAFCIEQSDGVTAVSESLRDDTYRHLRLSSPIVVVPNFLDCSRYTPMPDPALRARALPAGSLRQPAAARLELPPGQAPRRRRRRLPPRPRRTGAPRSCWSATAPNAAASRRWPARPASPSTSRSSASWTTCARCSRWPTRSCCRRRRRASAWPRSRRWPAALPVVASRVGGLPEVITDGLTGYLRDPDDHEGMAAAVLDLLDDPSLRQRVAALARASVVDRFDEDRVVPMYEALYERLLTVPAAGSRA